MLLSQIVFLFLTVTRVSRAWIPRPPSCRIRHQLHSLETAIPSSTQETASKVEENADDDDDDEYEYIEIERLVESDFAGSEWLVGTNWDDAPDRIDETWVRCAVDTDGNNVAIWGDGSQGKWSLDVASGFFSVSKESLFAGKKIWATTADDYYFMQGTVRGWSYLAAASVLAQWQAKRLGVDADEAETAPWFLEEEEEAEYTADEASTESSETFSTKETQNISSPNGTIADQATEDYDSASEQEQLLSNATTEAKQGKSTLSSSSSSPSPS